MNLPRRSISAVLADNLRHFMTAKQMTQAVLASRTGIGQTTISLYLSPENRAATTSGTPPSPTLARVQLLADALGVDLWELLRPLTPAERDLIRTVDAVIAERTGLKLDEEAKPRPKKPRRARAIVAPRKRQKQA